MLCKQYCSAATSEFPNQVFWNVLHRRCLLQSFCSSENVFCWKIYHYLLKSNYKALKYFLLLPLGRLNHTWKNHKPQFRWALCYTLLKLLWGIPSAPSTSVSDCQFKNAPPVHSHCRRTQHPWIKASGDSMATYSCPQLKGRNLKPTSAWEPNLTSWEKRNCKGYLAAKINPRCSRFGGVGWWSLQAWSRKDGTSSPTAWQQAGQRWDAEERAALKQKEMLKIEK